MTANGVDCVLLPTYPVDAIFRTKAVALAAITCQWIAICSVAQRRDLFASELIGPDGSSLGAAENDWLLTAELNRDAAELDAALTFRRPWRARARAGSIYGHLRPIDDPRSRDRTIV